MAPPQMPDQNAAIDYALDLVGLTDDRADVRAFYRETFAGHPDRFVTYDDLRKRGTPLDKSSSALAVGPCERARRVGGRVIALDAAQTLPLPECDRPGECACIYQARFEN